MKRAVLSTARSQPRGAQSIRQLTLGSGSVTKFVASHGLLAPWQGGTDRRKCHEPVCVLAVAGCGLDSLFLLQQHCLAHWSAVQQPQVGRGLAAGWSAFFSARTGHGTANVRIA